MKLKRGQRGYKDPALYVKITCANKECGKVFEVNKKKHAANPIRCCNEFCWYAHRRELSRASKENKNQMAKYKVIKKFVLNGIEQKENSIIELDHKMQSLKSIQKNIAKIDEKTGEIVGSVRALPPLPTPPPIQEEGTLPVETPPAA